MGTNTQHHEVFRLLCACRVLGELRLLGAVAGRVEQEWVVGAEIRQHLRGTADHPNWLATPLDLDHGTDVHAGDIDLHRRTQGLGTRTRLPRGKKRRYRKTGTDGTCRGSSCRQQLATTQINMFAH